MSHNTRELLADCLVAVSATVGPIRHELIVVDNGSSDGSVAWLATHPLVTRLVTNPDNAGFARANNQGLAVAQGRYALLLNSDAFLRPGTLAALVALADEQPRCGIAGARLVNPDGSFQASYTRFPSLRQELLILTGLGRAICGPWYPSHGPVGRERPVIVDYVQGACLLVRREAWMEVGGLDEGYFMYAEEVDWCHAMRNSGWQVWYVPMADVVHVGGGSSGGRELERELDLYRSRIRYFRKHRGPVHASLLKVLILALGIIKYPWRWLDDRRALRAPGAGRAMGPRRLLVGIRDA